MSRRHTLFGLMWSAVNALTSVLLPLGVFVFFAHVLSPLEIGVIALAVSCAEIAKAFGLPGAYEALLHHAEDRDRMHETLMAVVLAASAAALALYVGSMFVLSHFVRGVAPHMLPLCLIGLRIPLDLAVLQPQARLAQALQYKRLALRSVGGNAVAGLVAVLMVLAGAPFWGLVIYQVGQSVFVFAVTAIGAGTLARPVLHADCWRKLRRETLFATGTRVMSAANNYLDQVVVGASIGSVLLAYFNVAKRVEVAYITAANSFSGVLFQPSFAAVPLGQRGGKLLQCLMLTVLLCGPPTAVLAVSSEQAVRLVFGARWLPAASVVGLLTLSGFARMLGSVHGTLLSVSHRNHQLLMLVAFASGLQMVAVLCAAPFGLVWCGLALLLKNTVVTGVQASLTRFELRGILPVYLRHVLLPFAAMLAGAWGGRVLALHNILGQGWMEDVALLAIVGLGAYLGAALAMSPFLLSLIQTRLRGRTPAIS